jgi:long-chain-fatty-acid--CoA ligase ACSBG
VKVAFSSGAPLHVSTINFFMGINVPVLDMYGMSESTGPISVATINTWRLGSVGQCLSGAHLKIDNPDENGEGEVSNGESPFVVAMTLINLRSSHIEIHIL